MPVTRDVLDGYWLERATFTVVAVAAVYLCKLDSGVTLNPRYTNPATQAHGHLPDSSNLLVSPYYSTEIERGG